MTNEEMVAQLYLLYSQKTTGAQQFWLSLAEEEKKHAWLIRTFRSQLNKGDLVFKKDRFSQEAILLFAKFLSQAIARAQTQNLSLMEAFKTAFQAENGLLERKFFTVFVTDAPALKEIMQILKDDTERHVQKVNAAWNSERSKENTSG